MGKKIKSLLSVVVILVGSLVSPIVTLASQLTDDGVSTNYRDYNSIIFNDHTFYTADVEGSAAVGGNIIAEGGFSYAASAGGAHVLMGQQSLHPNTPGLILNGDFQFNSEALVILEGGDFVHTDKYTQSTKLNVDHDSKEILWSQEKMDSLFSTFKNDINSEISNLKSFVTSQTEDRLYHAQERWVSEFNLYVSEMNEKVLFADMSNQNHDLKEIRIPNIDGYDHVVIYSNQSALGFSNGSIVLDGKPIDTGKPQNQELYDLAEKLTWVLPNMTDIQVEGYGMIGDVYAPNATVDTKGGSVNGSLYVNNLISNGGFEVHNFRSKPVEPTHPGKPTEPSATEPSTTESSTTESSTTESSTTESSTTESSTTESSTTESSTTESSTTESSTTEPSTTESSTTEPSTTESSTTESSTTESSTTEPSTTESSTTEPSTTESSTTESSTTEPSTTEPSTTEPSTTESSTMESSTTESSTTEPSTTTKVGKLEATKLADKKQVKVGEKLIYTITAKNVVPESNLSKAAITDTLPESLDLVEGSLLVKVDGQEIMVNQEDIEINGNQIKVIFRNVIGNQEIEISFQAIVTEKAKDSILNTALVEGEDENPTRPVDPVTPEVEVPVVPGEKEEIEKTPGKDPKEQQNSQGKPATKNTQFLPKTGEYLNSNASIIQGLTLILGVMYLLVIRRKMKSNELE